MRTVGESSIETPEISSAFCSLFSLRYTPSCIGFSIIGLVYKVFEAMRQNAGCTTTNGKLRVARVNYAACTDAD